MFSQKAFEVMSIISVITNCALLSMSPTIIQMSESLIIDKFHLMVASEVRLLLSHF
jgi:hypothetical protein